MNPLFLATIDKDGSRVLWGAFNDFERLERYIKEYRLENIEIKEWDLTPENYKLACEYYNLESREVGPLVKIFESPAQELVEM